jgi:hypothetical protein
MSEHRTFLHTTEEFGLIDHINALDVRIGRLEMLLEKKFPAEAQGSGTERYTDAKGDYATDPRYGISEEYTSQSAHNIPTQEEADRVAAEAQAERDARAEP